MSIHCIVLYIEIFHSEKFKYKTPFYPDTMSLPRTPMWNPQFVHCLKSRLINIYFPNVSKSTVKGDRRIEKSKTGPAYLLKAFVLTQFDNSGNSWTWTFYKSSFKQNLSYF